MNVKGLALATVLCAITAPAHAQTTVSNEWTAMSLECSVDRGHYSLFIRTKAHAEGTYQAVFWKWGTIDLGGDQRHTTTVVDTSREIPVTLTREGVQTTVFEGDGIKLEVQGRIDLPKHNPPLTPDGSRQMQYKATLDADEGLVSGLPDLRGARLTDCTYNG